MSLRRDEIRAFIRAICAEIASARAAGATTPQDIADALNARGVTTRKGRRWSGASVAKFLASPGARRYGDRGGIRS